MLKGEKFVSMPITDLKAGKQVANVKKLIINSEKKEIAGFLVAEFKNSNIEKAVVYNNISSIEKNTINIKSFDSIQEFNSLPDLIKLEKNCCNIAEAQVLVENSSLLGSVKDFWIDKKTGKILFLEICSVPSEQGTRFKGRLDAKNIKKIGVKVIIAKEGSEKDLIR